MKKYITRALNGYNDKGEQVKNYHEATAFQAELKGEEPICWGVYEILPDERQKHVVDVFDLEAAEKLITLLP